MSPPSTRSQLRQLLSRDAARGRLSLSRLGRISRQAYAVELGLQHRTLIKYADDFREFERKAGIFPGKHDDKAATIRVWMEDKFQKRELAIMDGKIDRTQIAKEFQLGTTLYRLHRYPALGALIREFDGRISKEKYVPLVLQRKLDSLAERLGRNCPLNKDKLHVNAVALGQALGIPSHQLRRAPYAAMITAKEQELKASAKASRIDPYFHKRVFPFHALTKLWPTSWVERVAARFAQIYSGKSPGTASGTYNTAKQLLTWIGRSKKPACVRVRKHCRKGQKIEPHDWDDSVHAFRDELISLARKESTANRKIKEINSFLSALAGDGSTPSLVTALPEVKHARRKAGHIPSVAEAFVRNTPSQRYRKIDRYVEFARNALVQAGHKFSVDIVDDEASVFLASLGHEIARHRHDLPPSPSEAILLLIKRRLLAISTHAEQVVRTGMSRLSLGSQLLSLATVDATAFLNAISDPTLTAPARSLQLRTYFPSGESSETRDIGVANLLRIANDKYGGMLPSAHNIDTTQYGRFFQVRYRELGGIHALDALLNPSKDAYAAALTLYLCESGANCAVGRTLAAGCIEDSDLTGYKRITGHKSRANGKPIIVDLPISSPAIMALGWIDSTSNNHRRTAISEDAAHLFVMRLGNRCQLMSHLWYLSWFKRFAARIPELADLSLVPSMIRPSVLLQAALENDGRLQVGMAIGNHTLGVSQGYQIKWPTRLIYDEGIRRFQAAFETLVTLNIESAAAKMGISEGEFQSRLKHLEVTGLGTFCADRFGRPGNHGAPCRTVDCWNCPQMILVAQAEAIAALQSWQLSLREVQPEWERDRPERWQQVWLPWLCLADVVEEKMVRGLHKKVWNEACELRKVMESKPGYFRPRPW